MDGKKFLFTLNRINSLLSYINVDGSQEKNRQRLATSAKNCNSGPPLKSHVREFLTESSLIYRFIETQDIPALCAALADRRRLRLRNPLNGREV